MRAEKENPPKKRKEKKRKSSISREIKEGEDSLQGWIGMHDCKVGHRRHSLDRAGGSEPVWEW